ncbi:MAG: YdcF family protein [Potamolinea sp.]
MFDSNLCDRPFPEQPFFLSWLPMGWLTKILIVILLLLFFWGLRWLIKQTKWKPWLSSRRGIFLLFGLTVTLPIIFVVIAAKGLVIFLPPDPGTAVDAIVILGRGPLFDKERVNLAAELWQAKRAPMIFSSGRGDSYRMIEDLNAKGIPKQVLNGEECSLTTLENAVFTAAILQPRGIRQILLITDEPHMLRSLLVFRANGFTVIPRPSPVSPYLFGKKTKIFLTFREYAGLVSYALRGLYFRQHLPESNSPYLVNLLEKAKQYSQQIHLLE